MLHNNAAALGGDVIGRETTIVGMDSEVWDRTMGVNLRGVVFGCKHAIPGMFERGGGVIINTSSVAGLRGELTRPAYGTSKAAVIGFTRNVATQYGKRGIRRLAVAPGVVPTPATRASVPAAEMAMYERHTLTLRVGVPEDVANVVAFLASDEAAFLTGVTIPVDGGLHMSAHNPTYADEMAARRP